MNYNYYIILIFFLLSIVIDFKSQSIENENFEDTTFIPFEDSRNYLGSNITPLLSGIVAGNSDYDIKLNFTYKRNFREKNLRISYNRLMEGNVMYYDSYDPINTTDTSLTNRYFNNSYIHNDFRIGFEELKGYYGTRVHIGVDAILGYGTNSSKIGRAHV